MKLVEASLQKFIQDLSSSAPIPGGGAVAAYSGALGSALGSMVIHLSLGKKKYEKYAAELEELLKKTQSLEQQFLFLVDEDAKSFIPLSKCYKLPVTTEEEKQYKKKMLSKASIDACHVPIDVIQLACEGIRVMNELKVKGSVLAISDVGAGVEMLRSSIISAWLSISINLKSIQDQQFKDYCYNEVYKMGQIGIGTADKISRFIQSEFNPNEVL